MDKVRLFLPEEGVIHTFSPKWCSIWVKLWWQLSGRMDIRQHSKGSASRKGAIQAKAGMLAMIPGSMGTRSDIVSGLENPTSFHSAPHGAGRRFSRTKARKLFTMSDLEKAMKGIEFRHSKVLLDEIPSAYKDIDTVMEHAKELVRVEHTLTQFINVKGD